MDQLERCCRVYGTFFYLLNSVPRGQKSVYLEWEAVGQRGRNLSECLEVPEKSKFWRPDNKSSTKNDKISGHLLIVLILHSLLSRRLQQLPIRRQRLFPWR